jgi:excisionase family DNA binding protein
MARKYIELVEAAKLLGISEGQLNDMRSNAEISGYRDGSSWKFKEEDIEQLRSRLKTEAGGDGDDLSLDDDLDMDDSILLSEQELGSSGDTTGSTIIGKEEGEQPPGGSDLALGGSDVRLAGDSEILGGDLGGSDLSLADSDLSLADDDDLSLEGSDLSLADDSTSGDSSLDLAAEDDDLVLGESGDSDITISAGDSGISLADPTDSGISLEEAPVELGGSNVESLELGEDDIISLEEDGADLEAATQLKADDDFMLTPMEEVEDASDSGSQVIALDSEEADYDDSAATMLGGEIPAMSAMLEEDLGGMPGAAGLVSATAPITMQAAAPEKPEYPYSIWNVISLFSCVLVLAFAGMMMFDLVRNMWSWGGEYPLNSAMMDAVLGWFEGN